MNELINCMTAKSLDNIPVKSGKLDLKLAALANPELSAPARAYAAPIKLHSFTAVESQV